MASFPGQFGPPSTNNEEMCNRHAEHRILLESRPPTAAAAARTPPFFAR